MCVCVCDCVISLRYPLPNAHEPYCHLWPVRLYSIFPHYLINSTIFEKSYGIWNVYFYSLYNFCLKHFSFQEELCEKLSKKYICSHVKYPVLWSDCNETWISLTGFRKVFKCIFFFANPSSGRRVISCWQTDITKLILRRRLKNVC